MNEEMKEEDSLSVGSNSHYEHVMVARSNSNLKSNGSEKTPQGEEDPENMLFAMEGDIMEGWKDAPRVDAMIEEKLEEVKEEVAPKKVIHEYDIRHGVVLSINNWKIIKILLIVMGVLLTLSIILNIVHAVQVSGNRNDIDTLDEDLSTAKNDLKTTKSTLDEEITSTKSNINTEIASSTSSITTQLTTTTSTLETNIATADTNLETDTTKISADIQTALTKTDSSIQTQASTIIALDSDIDKNSEAIGSVIGDIYFSFLLRPVTSTATVTLEWIVNSLVQADTCTLTGSNLASANIETKGTKVISGLSTGGYKYAISCTDKDSQTISREIYIPVPNLIADCTQLQAIKTDVSTLSKHYGLTRNIDCQGIANFAPIGSTASPFKGSIDGFMYRIQNLTVDLQADDQGFIGASNGGILRNIIFDKINIGQTGSFDNIGGVVGNNMAVNIENVHIRQGTIKGKDAVGGIIGKSASSVSTSYIQNCSVVADVSGVNDVGGLCGKTLYIAIEQCYTQGTVTVGTLYGGGIVGNVDGLTNIKNTYSKMSLQGAGSKLGGLIGRLTYTYMQNSFFVGVILDGSTDAGGVVALSDKQKVGENLLWDVDTSQLTIVENDAGNRLGKGLTTVEMKNKANFIPYDFISVWDMDSGAYPTLKWEKEVSI